MPSNAPPKTSANVTSATVSAVIANYPLTPLAGWPPALPGRPSHVAPWAVTTIKLRRLRYVRFGSKADICGATAPVRFAPNSDRKSGHEQMVMSALPPRADMCVATRRVRFGPKADILRRRSDYQAPIETDDMSESGGGYLHKF